MKANERSTAGGTHLTYWSTSAALQLFIGKHFTNRRLLPACGQTEPARLLSEGKISKTFPNEIGARSTFYFSRMLGAAILVMPLALAVVA